MSRSGRTAERGIRCGLCGHRFDPTELTCHSECPLGARCTLICCPRCGYQVVDAARTWIGRRISRLFPSAGRKALPAAARAREAIPLSHVLPGREVEVVALAELPAARASLLAAFGIVQGSRVEVLQRRPSPVILVGETEIALAHELLERVLVAPPEPGHERRPTR